MGMLMENLRIPYGENEAGQLVSAMAAPAGGVYACPCCRVTLVHRAGEIRVKHFAHPASSNCNLESILHITAKRLVHDAIQSNTRGEQVISLMSHCSNCDIDVQSTLPHGTFTHALEEVRIGNYRCDVAGYRQSTVALAIEILNTHEVDNIKAQNLQAYWVELKAEDVINNPFHWIPTQARLKPSLCSTCKKAVKHILDVADRYGIDRALYTPLKNPSLTNYVADTEKCFSCKCEIPVFWWDGVPFCEGEPPSPKPKTIQRRHSKKYGGTYWANTCANCNAIQGDNFLYILDNAPFRDLPLSPNATPNTANVQIREGDSAMSAFMNVFNRNF